MNLTTETILGTTVYGTASGNYDGSSLDFVSDGVRAVNYYAGQGPIQTVTVQITEFQGTIKLQTSLNDNLGSAQWFDVDVYECEFAHTEYRSISLTGNYVWMRAEIVNFSAGTINGIAISY